MNRLRSSISRFVLSNFTIHAALAGCIVLAGCGGAGGGPGSGGNGTPTVTTVNVSCSPSSITTAQTSTCTATVNGAGDYSSAVTWTATGGTITSAGVFTPTGAGTATVTATSTQSPSISNNVSITVSAAPSITSVSAACSPSAIPMNQSTLCTATVQGAGSFDPTVTWTATQGSISSTGVDTASFTGPSSITSVTITATSTYDTAKSGTTTVNVTIPPPSGNFQLGGPNGEIVSALAADPTSPGTVYAALFTAGSPIAVWRSTDGAKTWEQGGTGIDNATPQLNTMTVSSQSGTIYTAGVIDNTSPNVSIFKSTDHASSWTVLNTPIDNAGEIDDIVIDPLNENNLYILGATSAGVTVLYGSKDQGATWLQLSTTSGCVAYEGALAADPQNEGTLYCTGLGSSAVYSSTDSGNTWSELGQIKSPYAAEMITIDPSSPERMFVQGQVLGTTGSALFMSTDGGHTWTMEHSIVIPASIVVNPKNPQEVFAGDSNGLEVSEDGGSTWTNQSSSGDMVDLTYISGASGATLLGANGPGLEMYSSVSNGKTWSKADAGISYHWSTNVAIDPNQPTTLFLEGTNSEPLFKSTDAGATWVSSYPGPCGSGVAVDPSNSQHILASSYFHSLIVSNDGGTTWQPVPSFNWDSVDTINFDPNSSSTIFVGTFDSGVAKSVDGGNTWSLIDNGLRANGNLLVGAFAISPDSQDLLVSIGNGGGLYRSTDGGDNWSQVAPAVPLSIAFDSNQKGTVYASADNAIKSTDDGATWSQLSLPSAWLTDGEQGAPINVVVDPKFAGQIFLIPEYGPVAWSPDQGADWYLLSKGLMSELYLSADFSTPAIAPTSPEVLYIPSVNRTLVTLTLDH